MDQRRKVARVVGRVNAALEDEAFICIGPGRWGSSNSDLGVPIDYGDIYHAKALVELSGQGIGPDPEPSLGTHFFQDLLEAQIYPLAITLDDPKSIFKRDFFYKTKNHLRDLIEVEESLASCLHLIKVNDFRPKSFLRLVMNDEESQAVAYLVKSK
jgi:hypothetical protein